VNENHVNENHVNVDQGNENQMNENQVNVPMIINQEEHPEGMEVYVPEMSSFDKIIWEFFSKKEIAIFEETWCEHCVSSSLYGPKIKACQFFRIRFISISYMLAYFYSLINPILLLPSVAAFQSGNPSSGVEGDLCSIFEDVGQLPSECAYAQGNNISLWVLDWVWMYVFLFNAITCFKGPGKHGKGVMPFILRNLVVFLFDYFLLGWGMLGPAIANAFYLLFSIGFFLNRAQ